MEAVRTSETSVDNHFTRQYNPEGSSEHHTRRRENLKSHIFFLIVIRIEIALRYYVTATAVAQWRNGNVSLGKNVYTTLKGKTMSY
jgi:hypothetical protein